MKKLIVALVALLPFVTVAEAQTTKDLLAALLAKWNKPTEPFKIIDNVYYVGTDGLASYLITSPQGHILVDTVMPEATSQIKASIEKLGLQGHRHQIPAQHPRAYRSHRRPRRDEAGERRAARRGRSRQAAA